jgi:hypothetical protein
LLLIKEMLLLNAIMGFVWRKVKVFQLIWKEQHIIRNSPQIKDLLQLSIPTESLSSLETLSIGTLQTSFDI